MKFADVGQDYFRVLKEIKFDSGAALDLGLHACFIRDYKNYDLPKGIMGIAVVTASIAQLLEKFG